MKKLFWIVLMTILLTGFGLTINDARLLRFPDINGDLVVFVYAGDIWTVSAKGGDARKLTSDEGMEVFPKISPDGKWIAFSAEYSGSRQVYVMPSRGGTPKQLTYYNDVGSMPPRGGFDYIPLDWTPDSRQILVRANRTPFGKRMGKYFLVNRTGGFETPLRIPEAGFGTFSPDAKSIVYTPICREFRTWKRTKGGRAQDVWTYDLVNNTSKRITTFTGTDQHPTWYNDKIYFLSDKNLLLNFWSYDLKTGDFKRITDHKEFDVLWPSGHDGLVAYENGGYIYILNLDTGKSKKITINTRFDNPNRLPYFKNVSEFISSRYGAGISPEGKAAVFDARGDLFTVPAEKEKNVTANLTRTQGVREMYPVWSPDGEWIAYISDKTGDYEIYIMDPKKKKKTVRLTGNHKVWKFPPAWSPNGKMLVFADINRQLQLLNIQSKKITLLDKGYLDNITDYQWSGDSKWVVYTKEGENKLSIIRVYSLEKKKSYTLSSGKYNDFAPTFSQCGGYIFFLSDRDFELDVQEDVAALEFDYVYRTTTRMYAMALTKDVPPLFKEVAGITEEKKDKNDKKEKKEIDPVIIDIDGIENRVAAFPPETANFTSIADIGGKVLYRKDSELRLYDLEEKKDQLVIKDAQLVSLSANKKKLLYKTGEEWGIIDIKPGQKVGDGKLELEDLEMKIDPVKEWRQIYEEGWRIYRDWFYVGNMHGVDWQKMKKKYAQLLPYIGHRADLDYILGELVGELNVGHAYVNWGDFEQVKRVDTGLLGAELEADKESGRYRVSKIYQGENWNERTRSPLTEQGVDVKEGDYIIRLNGYEVTTKDNPYKFLENTGGKKITITVNSKPSDQGVRTSWIKPVTSELGLFLLDWVESRRKLVDRLSKGRIGYIYVPDTAEDGNRELFKGIYTYSDKEAFIIDDRYNGGGFPPGRMTEVLSRRSAHYWYRRNLEMLPDPQFALDGPMVMLINHYSSSGGDAFPYWFRKKKLGILIGTRTWGGLVGYGWSPPLVDGPSFAVPMSAFVDTDGEWMVEGTGVPPEKGFEVYDRPEEIVKGKDPSIEVAVKYLLEQLEKNPPKQPKKPADPDRSKWHEKMKDN